MEAWWQRYRRFLLTSLAPLETSPEGVSRLAPRPSDMEEHQRPPRRARGVGGNHGEHRTGKLAGQSLRAGEQRASGQSIAYILSPHDAGSTSLNKAQYRLGKLINQVRYDRYVASLEQLPETSPPRGTGHPHGEEEARGFARARQRSQSGPRATAFLRARPVDSSRVFPPSEFVSAVGRFLGREEFLVTTCPCCGATDANTRHARLCHRSGVQVNQHQPLVHALSRTHKRMSIRHQIASGAPFNAERDLRMGPPSGHRN